MGTISYTGRLKSAAAMLIAVGCLVAVSAVDAADNKLSGKQKVAPTIVPDFNQPDLSSANNGYILSAEELALDCKKLTGHIQVRIQQLRGARGDTKTSELSRGMQQAATPFVAGTHRGIDPDGDNARDLTMLKAYNGRLAVKNCPTFNLEADLAPGVTATPHPVAKPKTSAKPPASPATAAPAKAP